MIFNNIGVVIASNLQYIQECYIKENTIFWYSNNYTAQLNEPKFNYIWSVLLLI